MIYDSIIVGAGPCGSTSAIYLKRFNKKVLVVSPDYGVLQTKNPLIANYYGLGAIKGKDIVDNVKKSFDDLKIPVVKGYVTSFEELSNPTNGTLFKFEIGGKEFQSKTIVLALGGGSKNEYLEKFKSSDITHSMCAICDGFFYKSEKIALIGEGENLSHEYKILKQLDCDITVYSIHSTLSNIKTPVDYIDQKGDEIIVSSNGEEKKYNGLFLAPESLSGNDLARKVGIFTENDKIKVNQSYETNIKGVYAGGDCIQGIKQIVKASNDGMNIAMTINALLQKKE
jgi:thioredoxin reductase (NADPH)